MSRLEFSKKQRAEMWLRAKGCCEKCAARLKTGEGEYDHIIPIALGGETETSNGQLLCRVCHSGKTHQEDRPRISKAERQYMKHNGLSKPKGFPKPKDMKFNWATGRYERTNP